MSFFVRALLAACACLALAVLPAHADLNSEISGSQGKDRSLQGSIGADSEKISGYEGRIGDLRHRLVGLQAALDDEQEQLTSLQSRLRTARSRLVALKLAYVRDRKSLEQQLVNQYELPRPNIVNVVLSSRGFGELLETAHSLRTLALNNAAVVKRVTRAKVSVGHQARELKSLTAQQQRVTAAALTQRDQVAEIKEALIAREVGVKRSRAAKRAQLATLRRHRRKLEKRLADIQAQAAGLSGAGPGLPSGGAGSFTAHGGSYGFFQAPGTNYSVGNEPTIAARLDVMGKALHLHLIGLSGYRTPAHSVEVGGFSDDPHTHGAASDTPGLEGVPEATLNHYGLTRPFAGAAEANHVQLK